MRKFLVAVLLIVVVLVVVAVALPFFLPREMIKAQLEERVSAALGREFVVEGPLTFRPWRPFAFSLEDVRLANPAWAENPDLARVALVDVEVDALAYLGGTVDVVRVVIDEPVLALEVDAEGVPSWQFESTGGSKEGDGDGGDGEAFEMPGIRLGDVALTDGAVTYFDHGSGERREFAGYQPRRAPKAEAASWPSRGRRRAPASKPRCRGRIGDLTALLAGEPSSVDSRSSRHPASVSSPAGRRRLAGTAVLAVTVDMAPRTLPRLVGLKPVELPAGRLENATFTVDLESAPDSLGLHAMSLAVDELQAISTWRSASARGSRVGSIWDLDLRPYLPAADVAPGAKAEPAPGGAGGRGGRRSRPNPSICRCRCRWISTLESWSSEFPARDEARHRPGPLPRQGRRRAGVGRDRRARPLWRWRHRCRCPDIGRASAVEASLDATGVELRPVLQGAADVDYLEGTGNLKLAIDGAGDSVAAVVGSLPATVRPGA
ncbi:MAG: AsmA family protein [Geminicoccaceae bacterium]